MKLSIKYVALLGVGLLAIGMLLGRLFFAPSEPHTHDQSIAEGTMGEAPIWTCSMHPQIRQSEPGDCPICGMDLIPLAEESTDGMSPQAVSMSPTAMKLAQVATTEVGATDSERTLTLNGKVQQDERRVYSQTIHIPGRIEKLMVNFTGEYVQQGSVLAYLYSPELVTAQKELLQAQNYREEQPALYEAAYQRLIKWKLTEGQIEQLLEKGEAWEEFPILADHSGYVLTKNVNSGDHVKQGEVLFQLVDLSRLWVLFDVYEEDLTWVSTGDQVSFGVASLPGKTFEGTVEYLDPVIDPNTRVAKARIGVSNPQGELKPGMLATGELKGSGRLDTESLTLPKSAVLWTGKRSIVYVMLRTDQGTFFEMREVTLGPALGDRYVVEEGLKPGEEVAVNGAFSIDAAAQLAGKPSMMNREMAPAEGQEIPEINTSEGTYSVDSKFREQLTTVYQTYLPLKNALVASEADQAQSEVEKLQSALEQVDMRLVKGEGHTEWMKDLKVLKSALQGMAEAKDLETLRMQLSPLSDQLYHSLKKFEVEVAGYRQYCPMAKDNQGAYWLSASDEIRNPYFGDMMLTCGNVEEEL